MKKKLFLIAITFIIIGVIGTYINRDQFLATTFEDLDKTKPVLTKQFRVDEINNLDVHLQTESLELKTANIDHIQVDVKTVKPKKDDLTLDISQVDGELRIKSTEKDERIISLVELKTRTKIIITIPKEKQLENCMVTTTVGELTMHNLKCKKMKVTTDVGMIRLSDLSTESLILNSDVGMMDLAKITGTIKAKTEVGKISLDTMNLKDDIYLESEVGTIDVRFLEEPTQTTINARSEIGKVRIFGETTKIYGKETEPYKLTIETEVGPIQVERE